ncbi:MAG: MBL fold metallo-hydrolase, partial [Deltaproteobacteria bacterium]|nr:MBL fold metallo-hydrolase [Deltaproteobacteria bacterium]
MIGTPVRPTSSGRASTHLGLSLNERLALIGLVTGEAAEHSHGSPLVADLFNDLWELVDATVSGAKVDRLTGKGPHNGFKTMEINAETGENLGRLNMIYLNKPIPCYYLVYVEVAGPFRNRGLGNRILAAFRDFLVEKSAVGILDNIIPKDDPTYDIYVKLDWRPVEDITGVPTRGSGGVYMVYVPPCMAGRDLKEAVRRLVHHIKRKRHAIDMRDNELMVQRTIEEFKELYAALLTYFEKQILSGESDSF